MRVGLLYPVSSNFDPATNRFDRELVEGLRELGYTPGRDVVFEFRSSGCAAGRTSSTSKSSRSSPHLRPPPSGLGYDRRPRHHRPGDILEAGFCGAAARRAAEGEVTLEEAT